MDIQSIMFWVLFCVVGFIILYASFRIAAWSKYNKIDEEILDLKGEEVKIRFVSAKKISKNSKYYDLKVEYIDQFGNEQQASPVTYQKITNWDLKYIKKNQPLRALAYKDIVEIDFSEMDESQHVETEFGLAIVLILKQFCPIFSKRGGFPPRHPRKKLLKELKQHE